MDELSELCRQGTPETVSNCLERMARTARAAGITGWLETTCSQRSPLIITLFHRRQDLGTANILQLLLRYGAYHDASLLFLIKRVHAHDILPETYIPIMRLMMHHMIPIDFPQTPDFEGQLTLLVYSITLGVHEATQFIIDAGADVNRPSGVEQITPFQAACSLRDVRTMQRLLQAGAEFYPSVEPLLWNAEFVQLERNPLTIYTSEELDLWYRNEEAFDGVQVARGGSDQGGFRTG